ncbi:MAG TPA: endolytic transglycosylase MltG [Candidatus Saccharimonadia bacterium]
MTWRLELKRANRRTRLLALGLLTLVAAGLTVAYMSYRLGLRPAGTSTTKQTVIIKPGQNAPAIADTLRAAGLIRDRNAFVSYINFHGLRAKLKAGTYTFAPSEAATDIAQAIAGGHTLVRRLLVPEGYTLSQIRAAAGDLGLNAAAFNAALADAHGQAFLAGKPAGVSLEGYLFPDSYEVGPATTASQLIGAMLDNFGQKVGAEYVRAFAAEGLTLHQGLTLASVVEKEVNNAADRPVVAQIFLKRYKSGQPLGSDVTAEYASKLLGLSGLDINANSPYNTRRFAGLPPGPICSPGLSSLDAVARPATTDYLYFLSDKNGVTHFAKTFAEHQANIAKYLQ